uniref:Uncharacterized protein n=1 Tax=Arundo donax TaxID=35708 RepID=A0A0A9DEM1_ARUDO
MKFKALFISFVKSKFAYTQDFAFLLLAIIFSGIEAFVLS